MRKGSKTMMLRLAALGNLLVILFALFQPAYATESIEDRHKRQASEAGDAIDKANQALKDKNYDLAITLLTKAIDSKGLESAVVANAYYTRGVAHSLKDECPLAIPDFDKALE